MLKIRAKLKTLPSHGFLDLFASVILIARVVPSLRCRSPDVRRTIFRFHELGVKAWSLRCKVIQQRHALHLAMRERKSPSWLPNSLIIRKDFLCWA